MSILGGVAAVGVPSLISGLLGKGKKVEQVPLETPEQSAARKKLNEFSNTGTFGQFTAGEEVPLGYGDYSATDLENQGLSSLQNLLTNGIPSQYKLGDDALKDLLATSPEAINAQFEPFKAQTQRQIDEANTALKRQTGVLGNLYSTGTIKNLGDIQARGNETLTSKLAELTNEALNRRLQAIPLAYQSAESQQNAQLQQIAASQQYGALTRQLNDAKIKARDAELLRRRQELQLPIEAAKTVASGSTNFGVPSVSQASPYQNVLDIASQIGGQYLGNEMALSNYKRLFNSPTTSAAVRG